MAPIWLQWKRGKLCNIRKDKQKCLKQKQFAVPKRRKVEEIEAKANK